MGGRATVLFLSALLACSALSGCFGNSDSDEEALIDLVVHYDATNGTIQQAFIGGSQISFSGVTFDFDFSRTSSDYGIETFFLEPGDGRSTITVDGSESAEIEVEYQIHGMYTVVLGATDINGDTANQTVVLRVDHTIDWSEANSADPDLMEINTTPGNEDSTPKQVLLDSTVENPSLITPGSPVTVTWELMDPASNSKGTKTEQIPDGEDGEWDFILNFPDEGIYALTVTIDQGTARVNIDHLIDILYEQVESPPNPYQTTDENEEENSESE